MIKIRKSERESYIMIFFHLIGMCIFNINVEPQSTNASQNILINKIEQFNFMKIRDKPVKFGGDNASMWIF